MACCTPGAHERHLTQTTIAVSLFSSLCLFRLFRGRGNFYTYCIPQSGPQGLSLSCGVPGWFRLAAVLNIAGLWTPESSRGARRAFCLC